MYFIFYRNSLGHTTAMRVSLYNDILNRAQDIYTYSILEKYTLTYPPSHPGCTLSLHPRLSVSSWKHLFSTSLESGGFSREVCSPISRYSPPPAHSHCSGQSRPPIHCTAYWHQGRIDGQFLGLKWEREKQRERECQLCISSK